MATIRARTRAGMAEDSMPQPAANGKAQNSVAHDLLKPGLIKKRSRLVYDLMAYLRRYIVVDRAQLLAMAVWVVHTYVVEAAEQTPYLSVRSPEPQCGKSRLLEVLDLLVYRPWMVVSPSEAVLYRHISEAKPTVLFDEVDAVFNTQHRASDRYEGQRALLNAGHRKGATVPRMIGTSEVVHFQVYCPKVLSGIGVLPDTIADRSLPIVLQRKTRDETVRRFRRKTAKPDADLLVKRIRRWARAEGRVARLRDAEPALPEELSDRMQEGTEPLLAIADEMDIGDELRAALVKLCTAERLDDLGTMRTRLLRDMRAYALTQDEKAGRRLHVHVTPMLEQLCSDPEAPWGSYYGRTLDARDVATMLGHYNIKSKQVKVLGHNSRGYHRDDLEDVWARYL